MKSHIRLSILLAAVCALAIVSLDESDAKRLVIPAIDSEEAASLCEQSGVPLADFWARAKAMGVAAAVVRPQSLDQAMGRGEILKFSRAEIERWKAAGLVEPSTRIRPDTFWIKSPRLVEQVVQAVNRQGVEVTTSALGGFYLVRVPAEAENLTLTGYDPERIAAASGLLPIFAGTAPSMERVGLRWLGQAVTGDADPASPEAYDVVLDVASWQANSSRGALLRRTFSRPRRLLLIRLAPSLGVDGNLNRVRAALRELSHRRMNLAVPTRPAARVELEPLAEIIARAVVLVLGILGPLFAARFGLMVLRRARAATLAHIAIASPVAQIAAALAATCAFAALTGLVIHAFAAPLGAPLGPRWAFATLAAPLVVAALTLYTVDLELWAKELQRPATYAGILKVALAVVVTILVLAPRWSLQQLGLAHHVPAFDPAFPAAWWLPWRWREILIGFPLLVQAMFLIDWRLECPDCASLPATPLNDPRGWFLAGLLAPVGIVTAVGQGAAPAGLALGHTVVTLLCGSLIGAAMVALRMRHRPKGPSRQ